jgi:hypothetical protein
MKRVYRPYCDKFPWVSILYWRGQRDMRWTGPGSGRVMIWSYRWWNREYR